MKTRRLSLLSTAVLAALSISTSHAATISQTYTGSFPATIAGTLPDQASVLLEQFTTTATGNLTVTTNSYFSGGFQPNLFLFNSTGIFVGAGTPFGAPNPSTGVIGDTRLSLSNLAAGTYTLAVTDFWLNQSITATNLSDGFTANFGNGVTFVDVNGNQRSGNYSFTIAAASAVPEPGTLFLTVPLIAAFVLGARSKRNQQHPTL